MNINVGEKVYFKMQKNRGRPFVGEIVKKAGIFTMLKMRNEEVVRVQTKFIIRPYEFKPYNTKKNNEMFG